MSAPLRLGIIAVFFIPLVAPSAEKEPRKNELAPEVRTALGKGATLELLSLDPDRIKSTDTVPEKDRFHGYRVLGRTTLKDAETRNAVLAALDKGIKDSDGTAARCFEPRHGLHAIHEGKTVDVVICFQCLSMEIFVDGKESAGALTTKSPVGIFNKTLQDAGVPLASGPK